MKVAMLGSGSRGNATLVATDTTRILVDAGFSGRQLVSRLDALGIGPEEVDALVLTHEHRDHVLGAGVFARRFDTPVYLTDSTRAACTALFRGRETLLPYRVGTPLHIGDFCVEPFLTVHDAAEPVAVTVTGRSCGTRLGIATDLGRPTTQIRYSLEECHFLILEANHDESLLRAAPYPASVQARIASSHGHLSNHAAATLACELLHESLAGILLAHLSVECNRPDLALEVVGSALTANGWDGWLGIAAQSEPTPLLDIRELGRSAGPAQLTLL